MDGGDAAIIASTITGICGIVIAVINRPKEEKNQNHFDAPVAPGYPHDTIPEYRPNKRKRRYLYTIPVILIIISAGGFIFSVNLKNNARQNPPGAAKNIPDQTPVIKPPVLLEPQDNAVFNVYPRHTVLIWEPVKNASYYRIEIQYNDGANWVDYNPVTTADKTYSFDFIGAQPGRWRVSASYNDGQISDPSPWRNFTYLK